MESDKVPCPRCATENRGSGALCWNCGNSLTDNAVPSTVSVEVQSDTHKMRKRGDNPKIAANQDVVSANLGPMASEYRLLPKRIRDSGSQDIVFGLLFALMLYGINMMNTTESAFSPGSILLMAIYAFIVAVGICCMVWPNPIMFIPDGIGFIFVGIWNICSVLGNWEHLQFREGLWGLIGVGQLLGAIRRFNLYAQYKHVSDKPYSLRIKKLIASGADVNAKQNDGKTELMNTALIGDTDGVNALLDAGADVNVVTNNGLTALICAGSGGKADAACVNALIAAGADVNAKQNDGTTALTWAAYEGNTNCVSALIAAGADVNAKTNIGLTALMNAVTSGRVDCVKALIDSGADVNAKSTNGLTALLIADKHGRQIAVGMLREAGAK